MSSSRRNSREYEGESYDDAPDSHHPQNELTVTIPQSNSTRSLTDSPPSGTGATPQFSEAPSFPPAPHQNEVDDKTSDENMDETGLGNAVSDSEETPRKKKSQKSPLLTAHRLSTTSLDDVNLTGNKEDEAMVDGMSQESKANSPPEKSTDSPVQGSRLQGLSGTLPSVPWGPPPVNKNPPPAAAAVPPPPPTRKLTSPFAWLSRSSTSKETKSPPQSTDGSRRNTAASVSTVNSNPELAGRFGEWDDTRASKPRSNSLKDQFRLLRLREEAAAVSENGEMNGTSGQSDGPPSIPEQSENDAITSPQSAAPATTPPNVPPTVNPNLAPGTVSGYSASASDASAPVDWELWQQLVNHGPQALSSSEALNAAIKRGIPQTIRGVIWQVLADSKNPELEEVYKDLVARGTEKEKERHRNSNGQVNGEKESLSSSRSSVRSDNSASGAHSNNGSSSSPTHDPDAEKQVKDQAVIDAAKKKKAKDDALALQKLEKTIRRDLGARTSYSRYFVSQGNQEGLFGLCKAYALYDDQVGYAQGMNFIAMPLLFNMDEVDAFSLLVKLMNKYGLREMFIHDMPGLHRSLFLYERLLEDVEPAVYCHLRRRGVPPQLYATQWFLTLFAYRFPLQLVLRIYDLIFEEGLETTILKFGVAIMRRNAPSLLEQKDMSSLSLFLKERLFDVYIDKQPSATSILESGFFGSSGAADKEVYRADILVQDACDVPLTSEMIKEYTAEWEEKVQTEKEREAELEGLKHTVSIQSARIRVLEEQAETSDKEHVQLASELVHVKVENEELSDLTDALKMQVGELKVVLDKQPSEVEEKLQTEMDRIMKRNLEVQNENRSMVEQMAEMEKELVEAKMKYAEIHENHESLKQKWSDLRKALD
ncbi:putative GTPase activating protein (Gyp5) [Aspergillus chevalieri]|uniref:GTPase-activating protein GYP5 n=1 Tax=Aspergillus chevalieri TaxID=182096 RepID=A0A7R7VGH5_ASPCH|nr:GTPase-activating protein [Aspergillus chevalieri]BCR83393.1 GTPase-activating protein [Aspergillus chevalieri]